MTEADIKHMVTRFLGWRLPKDFRPDAGITFTRPNYAPEVDATPYGTNLFDATQADAMVRYMVEGIQNMRTLLCAWTAPTPVYPEYVNLSIDKGMLVFTVRGPSKPADDDYPYVRCGDTVSMSMPPEAVSVMLAALGARVGSNMSTAEPQAAA